MKLSAVAHATTFCTHSRKRKWKFDVQVKIVDITTTIYRNALQ